MKRNPLFPKPKTRRGFLALFIGLAIGGVAGTIAIRSQLSKIKRVVSDVLKLKTGKLLSGGALSENEMQSILALSMVLVPRLEAWEGSDEFLRNHVNLKTRDFDGLWDYQNAVKLLNRACRTKTGMKRRFAEINRSEQDEVLGSILGKYRSDEPWKGRLKRAMMSSEQKTFRDYVVKDILLAVFRESPAGWALVGYSHYPGVPAADPRDYTRALMA